MLNKKYRLGVISVFINKKGKLLVAKRSDRDVWQFPQGGVDNNESWTEALYREMLEELGSNNFKVLKKDFL